MKSRLNKHCLGFTLVELIIAIVVMGVIFVSVMKTGAHFVGSSADPILRQQSIYIAEMFVAEIQTKEFFSEGDPLPECPAVPGAGSRKDFTLLCHYRNFNQVGIQDQSETAIPELEKYRVEVQLAASNLLGTPSNRINPVAAVLVKVKIVAPNGQTFVTSFYRADVPVEPG